MIKISDFAEACKSYNLWLTSNNAKKNGKVVWNYVTRENQTKNYLKGLLTQSWNLVYFVDDYVKQVHI